jgi:hypothetical protein
LLDVVTLVLAVAEIQGAAVAVITSVVVKAAVGLSHNLTQPVHALSHHTITGGFAIRVGLATVGNRREGTEELSIKALIFCARIAVITLGSVLTAGHRII